MSWDENTELVLDHCLETFGVGDDGKFRYFPKTGNPFLVRGIFDSAYQAIDPNTNALFTSTQPVLGIRLSDLPHPPQNGDRVLVKEIMYKIIDVQPDTQGGRTLFLQRVD